MELFIVNRYTGDEEGINVNSNEEGLKRKLLKKINERKRLNQITFEKLNSKKRRLSNTCETNSNASIITTENISHEAEVITSKNESVKKRETREKFKEKNCDDKESMEITEWKNIEQIEKKEDNNLNQDFERNPSNQKSFTILKDSQSSKRGKVKRKLPSWLANPSVVSVDLKNLTWTIDSIPDLDTVFVDKLKANRITYFFPVQYQIIPCLLQTAKRPKMYWLNDVCVSAPTGSGKTLAFVLPILQLLYKRIVPRIRALIVLPVQDLANQVYQVFKTYSQSTNLNVILLSKIRSFEEEQQLLFEIDDMGNYRTLVDIVVTTAGRLVEHLIKTKGLDFSDLKFLVIDEADKVMENMQNDWLYHLNKHINSECTRTYQVPVITYSNLIEEKRPPHKLLFSATLSQDPEKLQQLGLFHPKLYTSIVKTKNDNTNVGDSKATFIGKYTTPAELSEYYCVCSKANKPLIIHHLILAESWSNILCFVNSSTSTTRLAFVIKHLSRNKVKVKKLSADLTVKERNSVIKQFHKGKIDVLICSDALARGIDIPNVKYVISYDCPKFVKTYVHRIGRTGRAGNEGTSLALLTSKELSSFNNMIISAGKSAVNELKVEEKELKEYEASYKEALESLAEYLEDRQVQSLKFNKRRKKVQALAAKGKFLSKAIKTNARKIKFKEQKCFSIKKKI